MTDTTTFASKLAAIALTALVSATLVLGAVGPATALGNARTTTTHAMA